ncbi:MAG: hypothetical protein J7M05_10160 [Anaerolineae bacterium]|nr:hypothetical protein [Anaerolineae bacterium]
MRPRDVFFSTVPVYYIRANVSRLEKSFRWQKPVEGPVEGILFLQVGGEGLNLVPVGEGLDLSFEAPYTVPDEMGRIDRHVPPHFISLQERLEVLQGEVTPHGAKVSFSLEMGQVGPDVELAWCAYAPPILQVFGQSCPFRYTQGFASLKEVASWAREHAQEAEEEGRFFDESIADNSLGSTFTHLLGQTFHSWLINTWWVKRPNGAEWFSVWEGSCYYHSTVDVEFTQGPFYLTLWPELLAMELDEWPDFAKPGERCLGERGRGTLFLSHDMGSMAFCG